MKNINEIPSMNDERLAEFWEKNEPEDFIDIFHLLKPPLLKIKFALFFIHIPCCDDFDHIYFGIEL